MIRTWNPRTVTPPNIAFGGRLTLASATPVTTTDQTAKTTVFYTPYLTNLVSVAMDGGSFYLVTTSELSLALDSNSGHTGYQQSGKNFDLFLYSDSGTLRLVSGPAWTNDTTRATVLTQLKGVYVNSGSMTAKFDASASTLTVADKTGTYVGTMRASADGQNEDSAANRLLWNFYNGRFRSLNKFTSSTHTYNSATERSWDNNTANRVTYVLGQGDAIWASINGTMLPSGDGANCYIGIGNDSTSAMDTTVGLALNYNAQYVEAAASGAVPIAAGYHYLQAMESGGAGTNATFTHVGVHGLVFG